MRCFIALCLPEEAKAALASWAEAYRQRLPASFEALSPARRPRLGWSRPEGYHLTLAFLGEIEGPALEAAAGSLDRIASGAGPVAFSLSAPEGFPPRGPWRILFAALRDGGLAARANELVNRALAATAKEAGLPSLNPEWREGRPFAAHVTLARVQGAAPLPAQAALSAAAGLGLEGSWTLSRCALFKSELRRGGSVYTELKSVDL